MTDSEARTAQDAAATPARRYPNAAFGFAPDELLVACSHENLVVAALSAHGFEVVESVRSDALGLSRLLLRAASTASASSSGSTSGVVSEPPELDDVLRSIYEDFSRRLGGWVPTMGKNRTVGRVLGTGELSFGGAGDPEPVPAPVDWPPSRMGPGRGARVAVLDTAAAADGPLGGGWLDRYSDTVLPGVEAAAPASGHATFVAGLILSQAPGATVEVRQVLDNTGQATAWDVATAIVEAGLNGADVINLSLVCYTVDGRPPLAMAQAVSRLDPQIVVVAAAGNHGGAEDEAARTRPAWPAALPGVIAVGAADDDGVAAGFTPPGVPWVDLYTNGVGLVSTYLNGDLTPGAGVGPGGPPTTFGGFASWSGTSFAAALVTGAVAAGVTPGRRSAQNALLDLQRRATEATDVRAPFIALRRLGQG